MRKRGHRRADAAVPDPGTCRIRFSDDGSHLRHQAQMLRTYTNNLENIVIHELIASTKLY